MKMPTPPAAEERGLGPTSQVNSCHPAALSPAVRTPRARGLSPRRWILIGFLVVIAAAGLFGSALWWNAMLQVSAPHAWPSPGAIVTPAAPGQVPGLPAVGGSR